MKEKRKLRDKMSLNMVIPGDQIEFGADNEMFSLQSLRSCKVRESVGGLLDSTLALCRSFGAGC